MQKPRCLALALSLISITALTVLCAPPVTTRAAQPAEKTASTPEKTPGDPPAEPAAHDAGGSGHEAEHGAPASSTDAAEKTPSHETSILAEFWYNFRHNLFKPLLLFFYMGFLIPILKV